MKYQLSVIALVLCANVAFSAKLDNVGRNRGAARFNFGSAASSNTGDLFQGIGDYLPPTPTVPCESTIITRYITDTVTDTPLTVTVTPRTPQPRTIVDTTTIVDTVTPRPVTRYRNVVSTITSVQTVPSYITTTQTRFTTVSTMDIRTTTNLRYITISTTQIRSTTVPIVITQTETRTRTTTINPPPSIVYRTNTITPVARTSTLIVDRLTTTTRVQYTTVYTTQLRTNTITSTSVRIQPITETKYDTITSYRTSYTTQVVPGPTRTVIRTSQVVSVRVDRPPTVTVRSTITSQVIEPCSVTGYQYTTPAVGFSFG